MIIDPKPVPIRSSSIPTGPMALLLAGAIAGCGAASPAADTPSAGQPGVGEEPTPIAAVETPPPSEAEPPTPTRGEGPTQVSGGVIPRDALMATLKEGIPFFLQKVEVRRKLVNGRFAGWHLLALYPGDRRFESTAVRPGDTVLAVNGRSIERPEAFKAVWDGLAVATHLDVEILREGRHYLVSYSIEEPEKNGGPDGEAAPSPGKKEEAERPAAP
jgi:hypothetical protein